MADTPLPPDLQHMRPNPMIWEGEEEPQGVFVGVPDAPELIGVPGMREGADPILPADFQPSAAVNALFDDLVAALKRAGEDPAQPAQRFDLMKLAADERRAVGEILGNGEVSIVAGREPVYQVQESVLTGVWRIRSATDDGAFVVDEIEIARIPSLVREAAQSLTGEMRAPAGGIPEGAMNVGPVLAEIRARAAEWRPGQGPHVLNFTLFPMTEIDTDVLTRTLGEAPLTIVSGGFGMCRIMATTVRNVWAVQYLNAMSKPILDTVEIGDVPEVACAAPEDFASSATRLATMMETYRS